MGQRFANLKDNSEEIEADDPIALDRTVEEWSLRTELAGASRGNPILSVRCRANEDFVVKRQVSL